MKHKHSTQGKRLIALLLTGALTVPYVLPVSAAEPIGNNVFPTYDEAYYATLDYYGNLTDGSMVKSYILNGASEITDYGTYDEINNLTDGTPPVTENGASTFRFDKEQVPTHFYFEGKTTAPFETLPWTISVSYTLNGVPTPAEELAGKIGVVEILIDVIPNESASEYAKHNYTMETMALFNQDDILSLEAPGAQVQLIGNLRAVLFAALPGETQHYVIRVGSEDFSFDGLTFLLSPATLGQLEDISEISQRKDDLEEDYHALSGSLDTLLGSFSSLGSSLRDTADGLDELNDARETLSSGKDQVYQDTDKVLTDIDALHGSLDKLPGHLDEADQALDDTSEALNAVVDAGTNLKKDLTDLDKCLDQIQDDLDRVQKHTNHLDDDLANLGKDLSNLNRQLSKVKNSIAALDLQVHGSIIEDILPSEGDPANDKITIHGMKPSEVKAAVSQAAPLQNLWLTAAGSHSAIDYQAFQAAVLMYSNSGMSLADAKNAVELFTAVAAQTAPDAAPEEVTAVISAILTAQGAIPEEQIPAYAAQYAKQYMSYRAQLPMLQNIYTVLCGGTGASMSRAQFFAAFLMLKDISAHSEQAEGILAQKDAYLSKAQELTELLDAVNQNYDTTDITGLLSDLSTLLDHAGPEGLTGNLRDLITDLSEAMTTLDDTADVARNLTGDLKQVLEKAEALHAVIDGQVPNLHATLQDTKTLVADLTTSLEDVKTLLTDFRDLAKKSGKKLDSGTKKSLESLAATLRKTANTTDAVGSVKVAKDAFTGIVEDTWNEYTGDKNNLLMMDPNAPMESLTSSENPSPTTVQVLIRTQEIKVVVDDPAPETAAKEAPMGFWDRVSKMFRDFWDFVTGIFR